MNHRFKGGYVNYSGLHQKITSAAARCAMDPIAYEVGINVGIGTVKSTINFSMGVFPREDVQAETMVLWKCGIVNFCSKGIPFFNKLVA